MDIVGYFIALVVIIGFAGAESRISRTDRRVARVERKLDLIIDHLGLRDDDPRMAKVVALLRDDKKIQAIKEYREITGVGLAEAKEAVERMGQT
ncbi:MULTISPECIES: ribosomal protein L7/L12 [unclassified Streptomyces]|uniref:Ribosomal protein L7/L12 n=1 Tax=Streptomyces sp. NBC_00180 TaxID=2903632 RepID=A0AAU1HXK6_9ACTN|nr:ribosomal protein L7/L12 [Streptomyces sp. NBC_01017]